MRRSRLFAALALAWALSACGAAEEPIGGASEPPAQLSAEPALPQGWRTFERGRIRFAGPADLVDESPQGIDSLVGGYASSTLAITFDFGWYSDDSFGGRYRESTMRSGKVEATTVAARPARLATWDDAADENSDGRAFEHATSVYVPDVDRTGAAPGEMRLAFTVTYREPADAELARRIVASLEIAPPER